MKDHSRPVAELINYVRALEETCVELRAEVRRLSRENDEMCDEIHALKSGRNTLIEMAADKAGTYRAAKAILEMKDGE